MKKKFYFLGKYSEAGHEEKAAGVVFGVGYPVFSTCNPDNPDEKHAEARFVLEQDAIAWVDYKNG